MNILHISTSPRGLESDSYRLSQSIIACLQTQQKYAGAEVRERALWKDALPHVDSEYAVSLGSPEASEESEAGGNAACENAMQQLNALQRSELLIRELEAADCVVIATPMHNYTVPSSLKAWIDHVVRVRRSFAITPDGKLGLLRDRPVFVAIASGGRFSGETSRQPDFLRPYLKLALATIGLQDIRFFSMEGLAGGAGVAEMEGARAGQELQAYFRERRL
jgi:FMN-dependent NADH-azoreductase